MNDKNILLELKISSEGLVVGMLICILSIFLGFYLIFFTKQIMSFLFGLLFIIIFIYKLLDIWFFKRVIFINYCVIKEWKVFGKIYFNKIKLLARYLDTSVDYLLGEIDDKRSSQAILNSLGETNNRLDEILNRIPNNNFICSNLRRLREEKGLTIEDVEKALSSRGKYLNWELGVSEPSIEIGRAHV